MDLGICRGRRFLDLGFFFDDGREGNFVTGLVGLVDLSFDCLDFGFGFLGFTLGVLLNVVLGLVFLGLVFLTFALRVIQPRLAAFERLRNNACSFFESLRLAPIE